MRDFLLNEADMIEQAQMNPSVAIAELAVGIILTIAMWRLFEKSGEPGWNALVPGYNVYKLFKIAMGSGWWFIMLIFPLLRAIAIALLGINLAKSYGKSMGYACGLVFLSVIFIPMLAFSNAQYIGPRGIPGYTGFDTFGTFNSSRSNRSGFNQHESQQNRNQTYTGYTSNSTKQKNEFEEFNESEAQTVEFEVEKDD